MMTLRHAAALMFGSILMLMVMPVPAAWMQTAGAQDTTTTLPSVLGGTTLLVPGKSMNFARLPEGMLLPVKLDTDVHTAALREGDGVVAHIVSNITLPGGTVLAAGTRIFGDVSSTTPDSMWGPAPLALEFDRMQLSSGAEFPLSASIVQGTCRIRSLLIQPGIDRFYPLGTPLKLELNAPVQVAVSGMKV